MKKIIGIIICMLLVVTILPATGNIIIDKIPLSIKNGNTLYVGGSGPNNYTSIQNAINDSSDGDTVFVYDDNSPYNENLIIDKSINLIGEDMDTTLIYGNYKDHVIKVSVNEVHISRFTIQNSGGHPYFYAGIYIFSNSNTIKDNNISSNDGEGIILYNSSRNTISNNIVSDNGENGICLITSDYNNISNNFITSVKGRGIYLEDSDSNTIIDNKLFNNNLGIDLMYSNNNTIISNVINNSFSGLLLWGRSNIVSGNIISSMFFMGGIWVLHAKSNIVENNIITSNNEYGILVDDSTYNIISGNSISDSHNGVTLKYLANRNVIKSNIISNNYYGINLSTSYNNIFKNNFINNEKHAYFDTAFCNCWLRNYWEGIDSTPVRINGFQSYYIKGPLNNTWGFHIPWVNFDWLPAKEPYDI